jgi:CHAT domain-containing protein/Tfp pilus assembly protein PilF
VTIPPRPSILIGLAIGLACWVSAPGPSHADTSPDALVREGSQAYQRGAFEQAALKWLEATRLLQEKGELKKHPDALVYLAQAYEAMGQYRKAIQGYESALKLVRDAHDGARTAAVLGRVGQVYLAVGLTDLANGSLTEARTLASALGDAALQASVLNNLGNVQVVRKEHKEAFASYRESIQHAEQAGRPEISAHAWINLARLHKRLGQMREAKEALDKARVALKRVTPSHDKAYGLIAAGMGYADISAAGGDSTGPVRLAAYQSFTDAARLGGELGDRRAESYAWGSLGSMYETERRHPEALELTRRAIFNAQDAGAPEALYRWHWQAGRLHRALGNDEEAIAAYRKSVQSLQSIRQEMALTAAVEQATFRDAVGPLYFELADLLLQRSGTGDMAAQTDLLEARDAVEALKAAELRDYFKDDCVDAAQARVKSLDEVAPMAAVIYPIMLKDRLELLVTLPTGMKRFRVKVDEEALTKEVRAFRTKLEKRTSREYLPHAQRLYDWLIRPLEPTVTGLRIDTLVFVPDGPLRTIPMAALHDGNAFLITRFAVATTPGLNLTDPRPLKPSVKTLLAGVTKSVQGFPPLPNVRQELETIGSRYEGVTLINEQFLVSRLEKELKENPFSIVHIASHGQFEGDVERTFVLAYDDKLTMDRLRQYVGLLRFRDEPLELLTLSACETAAGDDRAALGLAGIAIKAGARTALATLWVVSDAAASELVADFYKNIRTGKVSKAAALQMAQRKLIDDPVYGHPGYWAAFLLLNNWL